MKKRSLVASCVLLAGCAGGDPGVSGHFRGGDKDAALRYVQARIGDPMLSGNPTIDVLLTEKPAVEAKDLTLDPFVPPYPYGTAVEVNLFKNFENDDYSTGGARLHHAQAEVGGGTGLQIRNVVVDKTSISGEIYSKPVQTMRNSPIDIDVKFTVALPKNKEKQ